MSKSKINYTSPIDAEKCLRHSLSIHEEIIQKCDAFASWYILHRSEDEDCKILNRKKVAENLITYWLDTKEVYQPDLQKLKQIIQYGIERKLENTGVTNGNEEAEKEAEKLCKIIFEYMWNFFANNHQKVIQPQRTGFAAKFRLLLGCKQ